MFIADERPEQLTHLYELAEVLVGAKQPGKFAAENQPDFRELLSVAAMLADKAPDSGRDILMNRLGLSLAQMNHVIALGRTLGDEEKMIDRDVKGIVSASRGVVDGPTKSRLYQIQADKESRVLVRRDLLRSRIGTEAFLRLQSFARLHIAPTVKVGSMTPDGK